MVFPQTITALCLLLCICNVTPFYSDSSASIESNVRLPTAIHPSKYFLHISTRIHQDILEYQGNVTIELVVNKPTDEIVLHAKLLHSFEVSLWDLQTNQQFEGLRYTHEHNLSFLRIYSVTNPLYLKPGGQYHLEILFEGQHQSGIVGFYKDTYLDDNGEDIPIAITQFEPTSARITFPCFDEPHFKARFIVSITHGSNYTALSNMPTDGTPIQNLDTNMTTTKFLKTPIMSTYLVAFAVTNYHHISEFFNGKEHRVFFPPNSRDNGSHTLKNGINSLTALENYFGIGYPLPKLDHIRVKKTYGIAMENWGLITYNNMNFVTNVGNSSLEELNKIISQNHEIAHQWFGNLVSPKWWTYVWLKEGFAVYFSYIATELVFPERKVMEYFISREVREIFRKEFRQPLTNYVEQEWDIKQAYNLVSYRYGGCLVRMFHHAIGQKTFIKGVSLYLTKFQYSVADENDLFAALQEAVDEENVSLFQNNQVATVMQSWTHNIGIPIVTITRNYHNGTITIRQQPKVSSIDAKWLIPLSLASASYPDFDRTTTNYIMPPQEQVTVSIDYLNLNLSNSDWLIVDKQQTGLYHVIYDDRNIGLLAEALNSDHQQIHLFNRAKLFRDLTAFVDNQMVSIENLLKIIQYLHFEEDMLPWENAADLIWWLCNKLQGSKSHDVFKAFIRDVIRGAFQKIFNPSKDHLSVYQISLKDKILKIACEVDLSECLQLTNKLANDYFLYDLDNENLKTDFALCQGIKTAAFEEFKKMVTEIVAPGKSIVTFYEFVFSLKCTKSLENLKYFLEMIYTENTSISNFRKSWRNRYSNNQALSMLYLINLESRPMINAFLEENDAEFAKTVKDRAQQADREIQREIAKREMFQKKHEENVLKWFENNYLRKSVRQ